MGAGSGGMRSGGVAGCFWLGLGGCWAAAVCAAAALGCGRQALPAAGGRSTRIPPSSSSSAGQTAAKENMVFAM